jgi:hypothetical protein
MANQYPISTIVTKTALSVLKNDLTFAHNVNRDWESEFSSAMSSGYRPGQTINIKKPSRYSIRAGRKATPQDTIQPTVPLTLNQFGVDLYNTGLDRTLNVGKIEDIVSAAMAEIVNEVDRIGLENARLTVGNLMNPAGALPTTQAAALQNITDINARIDEMGSSRHKKRALIMNPKTNGAYIQGFAGLFNNSGKISKQFDEGMMVDSLGLVYGMDQNVSVHTNGAATATNVNGANQTGSNITVVATTGGTLTRGTTINLPGVNAVNPRNRNDTGSAMDFVVTADVPLGSTSIPVSPALVTSGPFQNVTASPTTGSPYVIRGAANAKYAVNVAYDREAFTLAMVPMYNPGEGKGVTVSQMTEDGFTVMFKEGFDIVEDTEILRLDVLFGYATTYQELACKSYTLLA